MKIFIDFDDVLFNTKDFKEDLISIFIKNGVTKEQFLDSSYWGNKYNLKKQIESVGKKYGADIKRLTKDSKQFLKNLENYVFSDVHDFIEFVGKEDLFMVSYGQTEIQYQKIENAKLDKSFNKIVITGKIKSGVISNIIKEEKIEDEEIYFLDDRVEYIEEVKNMLPEIKTILMKRSEGRYDDEPSEKCDFVAKNLEEVKSIIIKS